MCEQRKHEHRSFLFKRLDKIRLRESFFDAKQRLVNIKPFDEVKRTKFQ